MWSFIMLKDDLEYINVLLKEYINTKENKNAREKLDILNNINFVFRKCVIDIIVEIEKKKNIQHSN